MCIRDSVGVVNDLAFPGSLGQPYTRFESFVPVTQAAPAYLTLVLRTSANADAFGVTLRKAVAEPDPHRPSGGRSGAREYFFARQPAWGVCRRWSDAGGDWDLRCCVIHRGPT